MPPAAGSSYLAVGLTSSEWLVQVTECKGLAEIGIALAWGYHAGFLDLKRNRAGPSQPAGASHRMRGLFPLPVEVPCSDCSASFLTGPSLLDRGSTFFSIAARECWLAVVSAALNAFYGCELSPPGVRAGKVHSAVRENLLSDRFLKGDKLFDLCFKEVAAEVKEKRISNSGEEISQPHPLSVDQIIQSWPPLGHGGSVPLLPFVVGSTKHRLTNPLESLFKKSARGSAPCQAKVHIKGGQALDVFKLLCARGITQWVPAKLVFSDSRGIYLNCLFGAEKPGKMILRGSRF